MKHYVIICVLAAGLALGGCTASQLFGIGSNIAEDYEDTRKLVREYIAGRVEAARRHAQKGEELHVVGINAGMEYVKKLVALGQMKKAKAAYDEVLAMHLAAKPSIIDDYIEVRNKLRAARAPPPEKAGGS